MKNSILLLSCSILCNFVTQGMDDSSNNKKQIQTNKTGKTTDHYKGIIYNGLSCNIIIYRNDLCYSKVEPGEEKVLPMLDFKVLVSGRGFFYAIGNQGYFVASVLCENKKIELLLIDKIQYQENPMYECTQKITSFAPGKREYLDQ